MNVAETSKRLRQKYLFRTPEKPLFLEENCIHVFDGGEKGNTPLERPHNLPRKCKWKVHHVSDLKIVSCPPGKGVRCQIGGENIYAYTLVPRHEALALLKGDLSPSNLLTACEEAINAKKTSTKRCCCKTFSAKSYAGDIGATALRSGGVNPMSKSAKKMDPLKYNVLFDYARGLEDITRSNSEYDDIFRIEEAKNRIGFQTMCSADGTVTADWTTALAAGWNIHVSAHKDRDFCASVVTAHQVGADYDDHNKVIVYFCFPRLGQAVPLRPGTSLFSTLIFLSINK